MDISIIVVTYNSDRQIKACLQSVLNQLGVAFEIIVVDNASADTTLKELEGLNVRVIASRENLGFGKGCNLGFASSRGRYVYLLNPDACLTETDALANLCRVMDANPGWGMAGTKVCSANGDEESRPATEYPAQRLVHRDFSQLPGHIAWIIGASMVVRRGLYEKLGGFDPSFFLYSEETDFCLRMRELGFEIGYIPEVVVKHIGATSEDMRNPADLSARKLKGLLQFRQKHYPRGDCIFLAKRDLRRARFRMFWNGLLARWQGSSSKSWQKQRQYFGIWEVSRQYLQSLNR
jgi:N-acetylglucosaminyl-diphospho-decaprenol L-rhamnosyltransferase